MTTSFKFIEKKNLWFAISILVILVGAYIMVQNAINSKPILNYGIDFAGGSTLIIKCEELEKRYLEGTERQIPKQEINISFIQELRDILKGFGLEKSSIQITQDNEILIKTIEIDNEKNMKLLDNLRTRLGQIEILEVDFIGPTIGAELRQKSLWIIFIVTIALLLYITWRFEFVFGVAALVALIHDALIVISLSAILNIEITTAFVAALLTVLGYSINDTIVIFDRIREDISVFRKQHFPMIKIANIALNQTLIRTINTSLTTLIVIGSLLLFGGTTIKAFCLVLLIGIVAGTYSSIFIASPVLVFLHPKAEK
jgi:preprotein translocase subunit SecF